MAQHLTPACGPSGEKAQGGSSSRRSNVWLTITFSIDRLTYSSSLFRVTMTARKGGSPDRAESDRAPVDAGSPGREPAISALSELPERCVRQDAEASCHVT
jgi:hypothetical protein